MFIVTKEKHLSIIQPPNVIENNDHSVWSFFHYTKSRKTIRNCAFGRPYIHGQEMNVVILWTCFKNQQFFPLHFYNVLPYIKPEEADREK